MPTFDQKYKEKVRKFIIRKFGVTPTDAEVEESCQSLFYIGRAHARYELLKIKMNQKI